MRQAVLASARHVRGGVTSALRAWHRNERAQDVLEFALLMPFVFFIMFVLVDFGLALGESNAVNHAVREAARAGAVGADEATVRQRGIDQALSVLAGASSTCPLAAADDACLEVSWNDGPDANGTSGEAGDSVTVRARLRYRMLNPFLAWLPVSEITLGACADSRLEAQPAVTVDRGWDCNS